MGMRYVRRSDVVRGHDQTRRAGQKPKRTARKRKGHMEKEAAGGMSESRAAGKADETCAGLARTQGMHNNVFCRACQVTGARALTRGLEVGPRPAAARWCQYIESQWFEADRAKGKSDETCCRLTEDRAQTAGGDRRCRPLWNLQVFIGCPYIDIRFIRWQAVRIPLKTVWIEAAPSHIAPQ